MAHYFLTDQAEDVTGLRQRDPEPLHRWCGTPLVLAQSERQPKSANGQAVTTRWTCPECGGVGRLAHTPTVLEQRIARTGWTEPHMPPPPEQPSRWQTYLDEYFVDGVLQVGIEMDGVTVRDTGAWVVADKVMVREGCSRGGAALELRNLLDNESGALLPDVIALRQVAPGYLMVEGTRNRWARLDSHLASWERAVIDKYRNEM